MQKFSSNDSFPKLRPILSSISTFNYNLARFLCDLLSSLVPNDYLCKDTASFICQIKNANFSRKFLVSYNVIGLFTNIPLQETIDIAINLIFNPNPNLNITKKELIFFPLFTTSHTHFIFNSKFNNQFDGIVMGSPLAPVVANIFMGFYKSKWLNEYNLNKPKFYLRYVDNILAAFNKEHDSLNSGSAPARIYGTPKMDKFSSSDSFPKLSPIVSSVVTFNYNLAHFLCDLLSPLAPNNYS